jgi:hypothetical protein
MRPVSVIGIESTMNSRAMREGRKSASFGIEMVTLENGAILKSIHGGTYKDSIWYNINGTKGRVESGRLDAEAGDIHIVYVNTDEYPGGYGTGKLESYKPTNEFSEKSKNFGHGGSDFFSMYHFIEKIKGNQEADIIDVYEAMDMFLPGMFAFRSILKGSIPVEIPNLRDKAEREKWRNDTACTDPKVAGDQLLPCRKGGTPDIDPAVYERQKSLMAEILKKRGML